MVKNLPANAGDARDMGSIPGVGKIPWRRKCNQPILAYTQRNYRSGLQRSQLWDPNRLYNDTGFSKL